MIRLTQNEAISVYKFKGVCDFMLHCVSYPDLDIRLVCYSYNDVIYRTTGSIPECVKCLTGVCSDLKGKKVTGAYQD